MPVFLTHAVAGAALGQAAPLTARRDARFWCAVAVCATLPDVDAVFHRLRLTHAGLWEHRGLTHSLLFAALSGVAAACIVGRSWAERRSLMPVLFFVAASHGLLDAMTRGGDGVAFLSPFDTTRYFLFWRPIIHASPPGVHLPVLERILYSLQREVLFVWPFLILLGFVIFAARRWWDARSAQSA